MFVFHVIALEIPGPPGTRRLRLLQRESVCSLMLGGWMLNSCPRCCQRHHQGSRRQRRHWLDDTTRMRRNATGKAAEE
jgi:hypothetical protein